MSFPPNLTVLTRLDVAECSFVDDHVGAIATFANIESLIPCSLVWTLKDTTVLRFIIRVEAVKQTLVHASEIPGDEYQLRLSSSNEESSIGSLMQRS